MLRSPRFLVSLLELSEESSPELEDEDSAEELSADFFAPFSAACSFEPLELESDVPDEESFLIFFLFAAFFCEFVLLSLLKSCSRFMSSGVITFCFFLTATKSKWLLGTLWSTSLAE